MANVKSLSEQVNEIKNAPTTKSAKKAELTKLGITSYEIEVILSDVVPNRHFTVTFGVEIETYNVARNIMLLKAAANHLPIEYQDYNHRDGQKVFKFVSDGSIRNAAGENDENCIECVTPVLKGRRGFAALKKACKTLNDAGAKVNRSTGLHVHIGAAKLNAKSYVNVFINYQMMEEVIDSFMANSRRGNNAFYSQSIRRYNYECCNNQQDVYSIMGGNRYHKVNPCSYNRHQTIEFRQHQGSTDFVKIEAWVNFCAKLVVWSVNNRMTEQIHSIDEIPFLDDSEKAFFSARKVQLG